MASNIIDNSSENDNENAYNDENNLLKYIQLQLLNKLLSSLCGLIIKQRSIKGNIGTMLDAALY